MKKPSVKSILPARVLFVISLSIVAAESVVMFLLSLVPTLPIRYEIFFDSFLLLCLVLPILYFFLFRPLVIQIDNREQVEKALRHSERKLEMRNRIANIFLTIPSQEMYAEVLRVVVKALESKFGIFGYVDFNGDVVCPSMTRDVWDQCRMMEKSIVFTEEKWNGIWGRALKEKKILYSNNSFSVPEGHIPIIRAMAVPIIYQDELIGMLQVANKDSDYDEEDKALLEEIAGFIAPVLHARLENYKQERKREAVEMALAESEESFHRICASAQDAIILLNDEVCITYWNKSAERIFDRRSKEVIENNFLTFIPQQHHQLFFDKFNFLMQSKGGPDVGKIFELSAIKCDGEEFPIEISLSPIKIKGKWGAVGIIRDITDLKLAEQKLEALAHFDNLTGIQNRNLFYNSLNQGIALAKRNKNILALLFLDLDDFKSVNDSFGHDVGDLLLKETAMRLKNCVRESDTVARVGGDEFTVILTQIAKKQDAALVARKIIESLSRSFHLADYEYSISCSIGISLYPTDSDNAKTLLSNADIAMYNAKKGGINNYRFYNHDMNIGALEMMLMKNDLVKALEREEFILHYQPQVDIETGQIIGMEALVRWQHPDKGMVSPNEFIPVAEEMGLITKIDEYVMRMACAQSKTWSKAGLKPPRLAINISCYSFRRPDLIDVIKNLLAETELSPDCLELELTESVLMQKTKETIEALSKFKEMGLYLSIDDFGTGYSSMSYLKHIPIYKLKIDRSFIKNISVAVDDVAIVTAIITMAHSLNLKVIAEGVETKEQLQLVRSLHCDEIQGFLFSRPLPADRFEQLLSKNMQVDKKAYEFPLLKTHRPSIDQ